MMNCLAKAPLRLLFIDACFAERAGLALSFIATATLFLALYPPCIPASVMARLQTGATRWMLFSIGRQTTLALLAAALAFTGGTLLGLTGWQDMWIFDGRDRLRVFATAAMALVPEHEGRAAIVPLPTITTPQKGELS